MSDDHLNPDRFADSAGRPWDGRHFEANPFAGDDGSADPKLLDSLVRFHAGQGKPQEVISAFKAARLLVPLLANLGSESIGAHGQKVDKSADLSIVTVRDPDGKTALPVFSSVAAMQRWNPAARPVPSDATRICLAAAQEDDANSRVILDPGSDTEFAIRRPAIWAIAKQLEWVPPNNDPVVFKAFARSLEPESFVKHFALFSGDPTYRLAGPELSVVLWLEAGLTAADLQAFESRLFAAWSSESEAISRVDSMRLVYKNASELEALGLV